jgi:hypothetical protein
MQLGVDIAWGDLPPAQRAGCPSALYGRTSRPLGGRDAPAAASGASSRIRKVSYSRRGPREGPGKNFGTSRSLDGREVPGPTPPVR